MFINKGIILAVA